AGAAPQQRRPASCGRYRAQLRISNRPHPVGDHAALIHGDVVEAFTAHRLHRVAPYLGYRDRHFGASSRSSPPHTAPCGEMLLRASGLSNYAHPVLDRAGQLLHAATSRPSSDVYCAGSPPPPPPPPPPAAPRTR